MQQAKENGKMIKLFLTLFAVMLCVSCGSQSPTPTTLATQKNILDIDVLKDQVGMVFVPAKDSNTVKISKQEAIAKAQESGAPVQEATAIFTALGYLSDPSLDIAKANGEVVDSSLLAHPLVWIISYEGVDIPSAGGPNTPRSTSHEYNVVIDATTGDYIMAFTYQSSLYVNSENDK